ncbi:hypothetical protein BD408DRAFT_413055 [Parasitella parasitica]|nr:hypothetical protein BD408DRAFT_413055 [Parasitella parasitica]
MLRNPKKRNFFLYIEANTRTGLFLLICAMLTIAIELAVGLGCSVTGSNVEKALRSAIRFQSI